MAKRQTKLNKAGRDTRGQLVVSVGSDMSRRLSDVSDSTINSYVNKGWLRRAGSGLILTQKGYNKM